MSIKKTNQCFASLGTHLKNIQVLTLRIKTTGQLLNLPETIKAIIVWSRDTITTLSHALEQVRGHTKEWTLIMNIQLDKIQFMCNHNKWYWKFSMEEILAIHGDNLKKLSNQ